MILVELTSIPSWDLPIPDFKAHLRLGSGFDDDDLQDDVLEKILRAAHAAIEARTGKVLLARNFRWSLSAWRTHDHQALPVAPVTAITGVNLVTRKGEVAPVDFGCFYLEQDASRPQLRAACSLLPQIPLGGTAEITFTAGFSAGWSGLPADLAQAVMLLATHFYEIRGEPLTDGNMPFSVATLIERYRTVRILGGGAS